MGAKSLEVEINIPGITIESDTGWVESGGNARRGRTDYKREMILSGVPNENQIDSIKAHLKSNNFPGNTGISSAVNTQGKVSVIFFTTMDCSD